MRFAVLTTLGGRVELRYFAGAHDAEGLMIALSPTERVEMLEALERPGFRAIARDDGPDPQLTFRFTEQAHLEGVAA